MNKCKYYIDVGTISYPNLTNICLFYHAAVQRFDNKGWAHYPSCDKTRCPKTHPELWNQEAKLKNETV